MTINQTIAQHGTEICIGAFGLASLGTAAIAVPAAVLATLGAERIAQCDRAVLARSRKAIEVLQTLGALDAGEAQRTRDLLRGAHLKLRFTAADLLDLRESATLPDDLVARILPANALNGDTDAVRRALRDVLTTAFAQLFTAGKHRDAIMFEAQIRILDGQKHLIDGFDAFRDEAERRHAELKAGLENVRNDIALANTNVTATRNALENLTTANRDMLEALAIRFGIEAIFEQSDAELRRLLDLKAQEYRSYRAEIEAIDERTKGLGNLKAAARDAAENLDFEEVETLLSRVHEVEVEIAAETAELRATNALLRGRVDQAFALFSAAADSFAAVDPLEPARRRSNYMQPLYLHGFRYGGDGMTRAIALLRHEGEKALRDTAPVLWAATQNNLAIALQDQGSRTGGSEGAALLAQAVDAYRDALTVHTRADHPVNWAATQNNLASALQNQSSHTEGPEGAALLAQAVDAYRDVLTVRNRADHRVEWAATQNNLAVALKEQAIRTEGPESAALLTQAVDAFREVLTVRNRADYPTDWAATQNNLAVALKEQGSRTEGPEGAALLAQAVKAYRDSLTVRTRTDYPVDWGMTLNNLANALRNQGSRTEGPEGTSLLAQAVEAYHDALTVRTCADYPVDWAMTQHNLAECYLHIACHASIDDPDPELAKAQEHVTAAFTVFDDSLPFYRRTNLELAQKITAARAASSTVGL